MPDLVGSLGKLQEAFGGGPLAAFLGIAILFGAFFTMLYVREVKAHQATAREVITLTAKIAETWEQHLEEMRRLREDLHTTLAIFRALQPKLTPTETPRVGG